MARPNETPGQVSPCHNVTCIRWPIDFDDALRSAEASGWTSGEILRGPGRAQADDVRRCALSLGVPDPVKAELAKVVCGLGQYAYGFDVDGFRDFDPVCVMRYAVGGHYDWHVDNGITGPPMGSRKLSFTLQLSPPDSYDGGDLEFAAYAPPINQEIPGPSPVLRQQGALIVFPSFALHRVSPVTRGVRNAIVGWVHGPPFR